MVLTDPLTGCLNRRGLDQTLAREVARAARTGSEIALLALDLDHFKQVNDTHGHPVGDAVLRDAGALLLRAVRPGDVVARTGGEEFAILMPDTGGSSAFQLATRLCDMVRMRAFVLNGTRVPVTLSIGVIATGLEHDDRPVSEVADELKARADEALYGAKRSGRDRVRTWTPPQRVGELGLEAVTGLLRGA
jgi:diguanylate cyclase (GGDEF)-like protein